jgi:hypothetical protein
MSSEFTKEEDYREVRKLTGSSRVRDCTQLSMMDSQQLWGSRNAISGNTALSIVQSGDFREGSVTGPNGETSTEVGKTSKEVVSADGTGHTSVVMPVKSELGRMRELFTVYNCLHIVTA